MAVSARAIAKLPKGVGTPTQDTASAGKRARVASPCSDGGRERPRRQGNRYRRVTLLGGSIAQVTSGVVPPTKDTARARQGTRVALASLTATRGHSGDHRAFSQRPCGRRIAA